jgi:hypothetical protein
MWRRKHYFLKNGHKSSISTTCESARSLVDLFTEPFYLSPGHSTKHYQSLLCTAFYPTWYMIVDKIKCLKDRPKIMSSIDSLDCFPKQPHESPSPNEKRCGTHRDVDGDPPVPYATGRRDTSPGMSRLGRPSATYTVIPEEFNTSGKDDTLSVYQTSDARKKSQVYPTVG